MLWADAEAAIEAHIREQWALTAYAAVPLAFEAIVPDPTERFVAISIEGTYADKSIYGSAGKRISIEGGIVFIHAFIPSNTGKREALQLVDAMTGILELQQLTGGIALEGGNPPSPVDQADPMVPGQQPGGAFYRCSGSVPFIVIGAR